MVLVLLDDSFMQQKAPFAVSSKDGAQSHHPSPAGLRWMLSGPADRRHFQNGVPNSFVHLFSPSYRRRIIRCGEKHPFWSVRKIIKHYHDKQMRALSDRPVGAVIKVCCFCFFCCPLYADSKAGFDDDSLVVAAGGGDIFLLGRRQATPV